MNRKLEFTINQQSEIVGAGSFSANIDRSELKSELLKERVSTYYSTLHLQYHIIVLIIVSIKCYCWFSSFRVHISRKY